VLLGLRGVALSAPASEGDGTGFDALEPWVERVLHVLLEQKPLPLVNVNFPREPRGMCWTALAIDQYDGRVVPGEDPMGRRHYWFTVAPLERHPEGTDLWAVEHGNVSLTPLRLDLTSHRELEEARREHVLESARR
jgi:5'-nucleotidase